MAKASQSDTCWKLNNCQLITIIQLVCNAVKSRRTTNDGVFNWLSLDATSDRNLLLPELRPVKGGYVGPQLTGAPVKHIIYVKENMMLYYLVASVQERTVNISCTGECGL